MPIQGWIFLGLAVLADLAVCADLMSGAPTVRQKVTRVAIAAASFLLTALAGAFVGITLHSGVTS
jgi:hypothetical protein